MSAVRYLTFCVTVAVSVAAAAADRLPAPSSGIPTCISSGRTFRRCAQSASSPTTTIRRSISPSLTARWSASTSKSPARSARSSTSAAPSRRVVGTRWSICRPERRRGIASIAANAATRARIDFTEPYYKTPARFAVRKDLPLADMTPTTLAGKTVGSSPARRISRFSPPSSPPQPASPIPISPRCTKRCARARWTPSSPTA